jgi:hypothetical protein
MIFLNIQDRNILEDSEQILDYIEQEERIRKELDEQNRSKKY